MPEILAIQLLVCSVTLNGWKFNRRVNIQYHHQYQRTTTKRMMEYGSINVVEMRQRSRSGGSSGSYTRINLEDEDFETVPTLYVHSRVPKGTIPKQKYALCKKLLGQTSQS